MTASAVVNVNNIYIPNPWRVFVKPATKGPQKLFWAAPRARGRDRRRSARLWLRRIFGGWPPVGREAETAQIDQHLRFQQIFRRHRQFAARGIAAPEQRRHAVR